MPDIEIEIDGKPLRAKPNSMVIQVADEAGIYIPRFCYHKNLTVAANCRMCLVEVEKAPKPLPACATPVMPGMKVFTRSPKALAAQKAVMEFLLINHPLDCPICDQGGECELQDLSMGYGSPDSYYNQGKRVVKDKNIGPLISTDMTRCIQCTRCVRFGDEIAGLRELGATGRGENMEIGTYVQHAMHSEVSGNIIDLCPVGALTSKPFRFTARAWELDQYPSIGAHDCVGANINVHTRYGKVMRVVPRENVSINETWISDRDRYSYQGLNHPDRLAKPMIRYNNKWLETDWESAFEVVQKGLQKVLKSHDANELAALASPNATLEEFYLLQKIMRQLGSNHIDHRLRQVDFTDQDAMPLFPGLHASFADLENDVCILLIGSNIQKEQPSAALRIRKASLKGAEVMAVNMRDYRFHFKLSAKKITAPQSFTRVLAGIAKALMPEHSQLTDVQVTEEDTVIAKKLLAGKKTVILVGAAALNHPEASIIRMLASMIAEHCGGTLGIMTEGCNAAGAWLAGAVPHRTTAGVALREAGLNAQTMLSKPRKAYLLLNVEPDLDCANPVAASLALEQAECVVALSVFKNDVLEQHADVILPIGPFTETSGTFVNATGQWQDFRGIASSFGESRPGWKVLRVLGNFLGLEGFEFASSQEITEEMKLLIKLEQQEPKFFANFTLKKHDEGKLYRIGEIPIYSVDSVVRRAPALQATQPIIEGELSAVRIHPKTAAKLMLKEAEPVFVKQQDSKVRLPVIFDEKVPVDAAFIAGGILASSRLSELFGEIEIIK